MRKLFLTVACFTFFSGFCAVAYTEEAPEPTREELLAKVDQALQAARKRHQRLTQEYYRLKAIVDSRQGQANSAQQQKNLAAIKKDLTELAIVFKQLEKVRAKLFLDL